MAQFVEVKSGSHAGRKITLWTGQAVTFGRSQWSDVVFDDDQRMSAKHFALEAEHNSCRLRDLESANGTSLNGQFVTDATLTDGDQITAGTTQFVVHLEGAVSDRGEASAAGKDGPRAEGEGAQRTDSVVVRDRSRPAAGETVVHPVFTTETCPSGLTLIRGSMFGEADEPAQASELASLLERRFSTFWIVDFRKLDQPPPDELGAPLFDWLPAEVVRQNSPLIISTQAHPDGAAVIDTAWDNDAVIGFCSRRDEQQVIQHLRAATGFNSRGLVPPEGEKKGLLGYCWPSVLAQLLAFRTAEFVGNLLAGIDAVLMEVPDFPGTWQIYAGGDIAQLLAQLGFRETDEITPPASEG